MARMSIGSCGAYWTASIQASAPAWWASSQTARASTMVPAALEAQENATTLLRGPSWRSRSARSRVVSGCTSASLTTRSRSRASSSQGAMLASWSSRVTMISSPACSVRPSVRVRVKFSAVMLPPKITSSGSQPRNRAVAARHSVTMAPIRRLVAYGAP